MRVQRISIHIPQHPRPDRRVVHKHATGRRVRVTVVVVNAQVQLVVRPTQLRRVRKRDTAIVNRWLQLLKQPHHVVAVVQVHALTVVPEEHTVRSRHCSRLRCHPDRFRNGDELERVTVKPEQRIRRIGFEDHQPIVVPQHARDVVAALALANVDKVKVIPLLGKVGVREPDPCRIVS